MGAGLGRLGSALGEDVEVAGTTASAERRLAMAKGGQQSASAVSAGAASSPSLIDLNDYFGFAVKQQEEKLSGDLASVYFRSYLSPSELKAPVGLAAANFGKVMERMTAAEIAGDPLSKYFDYAGFDTPNPDWIGQGPAQGLYFDVTTPKQVQKHLDPEKKWYGENLIVHTYQRP